MENEKNSVQTNVIDFKDIIARMKTKTAIWKPEEGKHIINFVENPIDGEFVKPTGEIVKQWCLKIKIGNSTEVMNWYIPRSESPMSIRAQVCEIAIRNNNRLAGAKCTLSVKGKGKERRYIIHELL